MNLTKKQKQILALVLAKNSDGTLIDFDQLVDRLPYSTTKDSMHFSIRALVSKGLVEKGPIETRRGRGRRVIGITPLGEHWAKLLCPKPVPFRVSEIITDEDFEALEKSVLDSSTPVLSHP